MRSKLLFAKSNCDYIAFQFTNKDSDEFYDWVCGQMGIKFKVRSLAMYPRESPDEERHATWGVVSFKGVSYDMEVGDYVVRVNLDDDESASLEVLSPALFAQRYFLTNEFVPFEETNAEEA